MREWLSDLGVTTLFIEPASPWENGYIESFNGKLRDELLNGETFSTLKEAQILWLTGGGSTTVFVRTAHSGNARRHRRRSSSPASRSLTSPRRDLCRR